MILRTFSSHLSPPVSILSVTPSSSSSQMKKNPNQVCWLLEKVTRTSSTQDGFTTFQQFLDNRQYTNRGILRYEKIFGAGYVSTGGPSTTKVRILAGQQPGFWLWRLTNTQRILRNRL